jgi:hypothetical protein
VAEPPHRWYPIWLGVVRPPPGRPVWGRPNHPQWPRGWFSRPLGQTLKFLFGPKGGRTTPWATGGGSPTPRRPAWVWPNHPGWFGHFSIFFWIFFFKKKCDGGILGINRLNELNCHNLKVYRVKCHILNFGGKSKNEWILQGVKCNFPIYIYINPNCMNIF